MKATDATPTAAGALEAGTARELSQVFLALFRSHAAEMLKPEDEQELAARWDGPDWADRLAEAPARLVSWTDVTALVEQHPERVFALWARIKQEAREELAGGHRAALALRDGSEPWERAQFLAIRDAFVEEWRPRGGIELALIDQMATAHSEYLGWLERLHVERQNRAIGPNILERNAASYDPPRVSAAEAVEEAAAMAERFQRLFVRAVRTLRDLRRFTPSVVVQNAGQVNVAHQQVNTTGGGADA
jgi:hypothetical protein